MQDIFLSCIYIKLDKIRINWDRRNVPMILEYKKSTIYIHALGKSFDNICH